MKKNMVPLVGIAVVVAIISTGVFYGLFAGKLRSASADVPGKPVVVAARDLERGAVLKASDLRVSQLKGALSGSFSKPDELVGATLLSSVQQDEPLLEERLASKTSGSSAHGAVPAGWRAVSIRVSDSDSLLAFLKLGAKVDLQALLERNGSLELRTVLQNVEVLAVNPQPQPAGNRGPVSIVTILARAQDADLVALADSGTRLRVALRNPLDQQTSPRRALALGSVFQSNGLVAEPPAEVQKSAAVAAPDAAPMQLNVQVLRTSAAAQSELESKLVRGQPGDSIGVAPFRPDTDGEQLVRDLALRKEVEVVLSKTLTASAGQPARLHAGSGLSQLRMQLSEQVGPGGEVNLRISPEISLPSGAGLATRRFDAELPSGGSILVTGLVDQARDRASLERLFPSHTWTSGSLAILVTPVAGKTPASSVARTTQVR